MNLLKNETIWINHQAHFKPDIYTFKNGFITYYIENYRLYAQVWKSFEENGAWKSVMYLHHTSEICEDEDRSMRELIDG